MLQRTNELAVLGRRDGDGQGGDQHGDVVVGADELARPRWAARNAASGVRDRSTCSSWQRAPWPRRTSHSAVPGTPTNNGG